MFKEKFAVLLFFVCSVCPCRCQLEKVEPVSKDYLHESKEAKDARMSWWREARFGMFIHWGLYAIPAGQWKGETNHAEWIRHTAQIPIDEYDKFVGQFNPVQFNADQWVRMAKDAGMKYIVITSKHHDGFCLFDSKNTDYDVMNTPFKRDILKELSMACKRHGVKFCFYHSIMDWHHPDYLPRRQWEKRSSEGADLQRYITHMKSQLKELVTEYDPAVLWFDGEWEDTWTHEEGLKLYNYVRSLKPGIIINNRVDTGRKGMQGMTKAGSFAGDFGTPEQEVPHAGIDGVDWESCITMNNHWGYNSHDKNFKSAKFLISQLVEINSKGGNYLLNIGPKADGTFPQESIDRLAEMGKWMKINGEAVYGTTRWANAVYDKEYMTLTRMDATIDFEWGGGRPDEKISDNDFDITWTGFIVPKYSEEYTFYTYSDDGVKLWINGKLIIENWTEHSPIEDIGKITLDAGREYSLRMEYYEKSGGATAKLSWSSPSQSKQTVPANALQDGLKGVYRSKKSQSLFFTAKGDTVYAITTDWPGDKLDLAFPKRDGNIKVKMLGRKGNLKWNRINKGISVDLSGIDTDDLPCDYAWVFKIK
jgi:alpha-L-fucosidase